MVQKFNNADPTYTVSFVYKQKFYQRSFQSSAKFSLDMDKQLARDLVDDVIKLCLRQIPDRENGIFPHDIVLKGDFGTLTLSD